VRTPLFTWHAMSGANSYFVVVAKDANFSNIIDEAFTRIPAYAPRNQLKPTTYPDETTTFYWLVLPATLANGNDALTVSLSAANGSFQKQSTPPSLVSPVGVQAFVDQPTFRWSPTLGARRYRLQVSADPTFGSPLDDVVTDATSYSSDTTYPADTVLYWRVRADDENLTGLTWSATGTFQKKLGAPVQKVLGEAAPLPAQLMAAKGIIPGAKPHEIVIAVSVLSGRADDKVRDAALATLSKLPPPILNGALSADLPESVINQLLRMGVRARCTRNPSCDLAAWLASANVKVCARVNNVSEISTRR